MTELKDRLDRLADAAVGAVRLDDPSTGSSGSSGAPGARGDRRRAWPWIGSAAAAVVLVVAVVAVLANGGSEEDGPVTAGPGSPAAPVLSVILPDGPGPPDLPTVQITGPDGDVGPLRSAAEVREPVAEGSSDIRIARGLITRLPAAGTYDVVISLSGVQVTCPVDAAAGQRLILTLVGGECGRVQTVDQWAPEDTDVGLDYVGLPEDEAIARITADGYESEVVGRDGIALLSMPEPGRLDLWIFDGLVVAANGVGRTIDEARTSVAVVLISDTGALVGTGTVWVAAGRESRLGQWEARDAGASSAGLLLEDLRPGPARLETPCTLDIDLAAAGTVVTISVAPDGTVSDPECPATVETLDEHVAEVTDDWDAYEPADDYLGLTEAEAEARADEDGLEVRVLARDGQRFGQDDDLRTDRVNVVLYDDEVRAAALF